MNSPASDSRFNCKAAEAPRRMLTLSLHERPQIGEIDLLIDHPKHGDCVKVGCIYIDNEPGTLPLNEARSLADMISGRFNSHAALVALLERTHEVMHEIEAKLPDGVNADRLHDQQLLIRSQLAALKSATA